MMICHECKLGDGRHTPECKRGRALKQVLQENDFLYGNAPITAPMEYTGMVEARQQYLADQVKPSWADDARFKDFTAKGVASFELSHFDPLDFEWDRTEARIRHVCSKWARDLNRTEQEVFGYVSKLLAVRHKTGMPLNISYYEVEAHYLIIDDIKQ